MSWDLLSLKKSSLAVNSTSVDDAIEGALVLSYSTPCSFKDHYHDTLSKQTIVLTYLR